MIESKCGLREIHAACERLQAEIRPSPKLTPKILLLNVSPIGRIAKQTNRSRQSVRALDICCNCVTKETTKAMAD